MACLEEPPVRVFRTSDPERLVEGLRGADLHACQLSHRPAPSELARVPLPGASVDLVNLGPEMLFTGALPPDCYSMIYVHRCPNRSRAFMFDIEHVEGVLGCLAPGTMLDATTSAGYGNAALVLPAADFRAAIAASPAETSDSLLTRSGLMHLDAPHRQAMDALVAGLWELVRDPSQPFASEAVRQAAARAIRETYLDALLAGSTHPMAHAGLRIARRYERLRQARDYLAAHAHRPVYVDDLCAATGIGRRGLEHLFKDLLGISPTGYLRRLRLHGVRRALRQSAWETGSVKRHALEWGFWHLGDFCRDYRALFGETPTNKTALT
jgi:AraC family transcriptional regulator, ethanolamine operon transcriptional activator